MSNMHQKLMKYYNKHIRLGSDERRALAEYREVNLKRLAAGLTLLGADDSVIYPGPIRDCNQGGYAMHTLNQCPENDYDIDVALVFRKDALPASALDARKRVEAAFQMAGGNFAREPEARTNAVTIWYAEGYHIDFAVYREYENSTGQTVVEHAGPEWTARNPTEITDWFNAAVKRLSPAKSPSTSVDEDQLRRIVRYLKAFARSREDWSLPGGLVITVLAVECYCPDPHRDDVALLNTLRAVQRRLTQNLEVLNPVDPAQVLTAKAKCLSQVERLRDRLAEAETELQEAFQWDSSEGDAIGAWHWFFQHPFWAAAPVEKAVATEFSTPAERVAMLGSVRIRAELAMRHHGPIRTQYPSGSRVLPKNIWLRFSVADTTVKPPYAVRWIVHNHGDEATEVEDLTHCQYTDQAWERTLYAGRHTMTCELHRNGTVLARSQHVVRIR
ncbi:MAG: hypothetical protein IT318_08640 [Anaerolineales bacterium]|nr:hypothetical protein [Anaerolineales bacterium]